MEKRRRPILREVRPAAVTIVCASAATVALVSACGDSPGASIQEAIPNVGAPSQDASTAPDKGRPISTDGGADSAMDAKPAFRDAEPDADRGGPDGIPSALAEGQRDIRGLAIDSRYVYWSTFQTRGTVMGVGKAGGARAIIGFAQDYPMAVVRDVDASGKIYWTNWGISGAAGTPIGAVKVGGFGHSETAYSPGLFNQNHPAAIGVDETRIYWVNNGSGSLMADAKGSGNHAQQLSSALAGAFAIAVDPRGDGAVFCLVRGTATDGSAGSLERIEKAGGPPQALAASLAFTDVLFDFDNIALDDSFVYVATAAKVLRIAKDGSGTVELATTAAAVHGLAVDQRFVYWSEWASPGELRRAPKAGGSAEILARVKTPTSIEVDDDAIYWADTGDGTVMKLPK